MSKEQEASDKPKPTQEQLQSELLAYLEDAKVGTPKYIALADILATLELDNRRVEHINAVERREKDEKPSRYHVLLAESNLRMTEMEIALLKRDIRINESKIPGYKAACYHIRESLDELEQRTIYRISREILETFEE